MNLSIKSPHAVAQRRELGSSVSAPAVTAAFDKAFKWSTEVHALNGNNSDVKLTGKIDPKTLPGTAGKMFAAVTKNKNYDTLNAFQLSLAGQKVFAIMGSNGKPPSDTGLALFAHTGKQLAFKDVMGLNQWQFDAKGNARNMALGAGLPGAPRVVAPKPLSPAAKSLTAAFDKKFPFNNDTDTWPFPNSAQYKGAVPKNTDMSHMADSSRYDYSNVYKLDIGGKSVFAVNGVADAVNDLALFTSSGKRIAFNGGDWVP
jgi:hypothetical protein